MSRGEYTFKNTEWHKIQLSRENTQHLQFPAVDSTIEMFLDVVDILGQLPTHVLKQVLLHDPSYRTERYPIKRRGKARSVLASIMNHQPFADL